MDHAAAGLNYAVRFSAELEPVYWDTSADVPTVLATEGVIEVMEVPFPGLIPASGGKKNARFFSVSVSSS